MLLVLLACAQGRPEAYADCVVEVTAISERTEDASYRSVDTYDAAARLVTQRQEDLAGEWSSEATFVYDGPCLLEEHLVSESGGDVWEMDTVTRCDEHGHPERTEQSGTAVRADGEEGEVTSVTVYDNQHDAAGRLLRVATAAPGDPNSLVVKDHEWGAFCAEPVVTTRTGTDGLRIESTLVCAADGRKLDGSVTGFDASGERLGRSTWRREYDSLGRMVTYAGDDDGDGFDDRVHENTWVDTASPGPAAQIARWRDEVTMRWSFAYDCP
ncbi:MAG: hypothetical protein ACK4YP_08445 [Myxococcota bacterium]